MLSSIYSVQCQSFITKISGIFAMTSMGAKPELWAAMSDNTLGMSTLPSHHAGEFCNATWHGHSAPAIP
ncbi:hypothetical protein Y1Q_0017615 [Alligator mississippiensis]|uniref:Uncharacterized protein n=1 Tax=Alligator mississippiensis TaxID=8496 RepID=A0A151P3L2_ALLMI|nr:hypothetical protein Y1Q_0017615 [Alligator mississippiensis]